MNTITSQLRGAIRETGLADQFWTNKYKSCRTVKCNLDPALIDSYDAFRGPLAHLNPGYYEHPIRKLLDAVWDCAKKNKTEVEIKWIDHRISGPVYFMQPISFIVTIPN